MTRRISMLAPARAMILIVPLAFATGMAQEPPSPSTGEAATTIPRLSPDFARRVKQHEKRRPPLFLNAPAARMIASPAPAPVIPPNKVGVLSQVNEGRDDMEREELQQVAARLSDPQLIRPERFQFYSAVNQPPDYAIGGWRGTIRQAEPLPGGGYRVSVNVVPVLSSPSPGLNVHTFYTEVYDVKGQEVRFVQALDPRNQAGQMPSLYTF